ncbi:MAG: AraC family transcriptional regulator [Sphaerochaetaceae bacterium]|nr:AraC family transcriptional regulator [Sphaerochaetaceae bacterium]
MEEIIDTWCWEDHNKVITYDQHKIQGLKNITFSNPSTATPPSPEHYHSDIIEIHCLIKGKRVCHVNNETYTVTGNEMFLTFPFEPHHTSRYHSSPYTFFGLQIDLKDQDHLLGLNVEYSRALYKLLTSCEYRHLRFPASDAQWLKQGFSYISDGNESSKMLGVQFFTSFLFKIQDFIPVKRDQKVIFDSNIKRVIDHIEKQDSENTSLQELAAISGYSLSRFKSKFKEVVGFPPASYITLKKLEHAKQLLAHTDLSITQIAMDAGFSSSNYFCTKMKNLTSYSPIEYRRASRKNKDEQ